jgi:hypothetical protein
MIPESIVKSSALRALLGRKAGLVLAFCGAIALAAPAHAGLLISADFGPQITNTHNFTGVEADAAAASGAFAGANTWNALRVADYGGAPSVNPGFAALKDSAGAATAVNFSITGQVNGFDFIDFYGAFPPDALRHDVFFFNSRFASTSIDWQITGLAAGAEYRFYAYGARADAVRLFDMLVDTDGDGLLGDETAKAIGSSGTDMQHYQDAYFASVLADASGVIHGRGVGRIGIEANWSGFQLARVDANTVPEPGALALCGCALFGLRLLRRGRNPAARNQQRERSTEA